MSGAGFEPLTEAEMFALAGTGAAKAVGFKDPAFAISQVSIREFVAMGLLIDSLGLSTPDALPKRTRKPQPADAGGL